MLEGLNDLERLLEHRTRLAACVVLAKGERLTFAGLKELLGETDGNLGAHLKKLERSGFLTATRSAAASRPRTWYRLTSTGHRALSRHLAALEALARHATD